MLSKLKTLSDVALMFQINDALLGEYVSSENQAGYFRAIEVPKKNPRRSSEFRTVYWARKQWLRQGHYAVTQVVTKRRLREVVHGYVATRSPVTNARQHLAARVVLHADVENFFDSVTVVQVRQAFASLGAKATVAEILARFCTIDGFLRQGTRCAPALANLVCRHLDGDLADLAADAGATYTRYADDLTFSGDAVPSAEAIATLVESHGFHLRRGCITQLRGRCQVVTGLTIGHTDKPRVTRRVKRRIRLMMHYVARFGLEAHLKHASNRGHGHSRENSLRGLIAYLKSVEPALAMKYVSLLPPLQRHED
jgi:RNA-directed DNA polymerase